jgi:hypothetical protein
MVAERVEYRLIATRNPIVAVVSRSPLPVFRVRSAPPCPDGADPLACKHYLRQHE